MRKFLLLVLGVFLLAVTVFLVAAFRMIWADESSTRVDQQLLLSGGVVAAACVFVLVACRTVVDLRRAASVRNEDAPGSNR